MNDRDRTLLALIEEARAEMNARLDMLEAELREGILKVPMRRRAPLRPPLGAPVLMTDDIARAKARAALERMGLVRAKG